MDWEASIPGKPLLSNGYQKDNRNNINTTLRLNYDLSSLLTKGLSYTGVSRMIAIITAVRNIRKPFLIILRAVMRKIRITSI